VCTPRDYDAVAGELETTGGLISRATRARLAAEAFATTAAYDARIAEYLGAHLDEPDESAFPPFLWHFSRVSDLRYGENPHQSAVVYSVSDPSVPSLAQARILSGKPLSYNNYGDLDAAWRMAADFEEPFAAVFKHATPCGAAIGKTIGDAYKAAYETDPLSAFGSIIALNRRVDLACAEVLHQTAFIECVLAPGYDEDALALMKRKKSRRLLEVPTMDLRPSTKRRFREIAGGLLVQDEDWAEIEAADLKVVTKKAPTAAEIDSLLLGRKIVKHAKSNAIAIIKGNAAVGIGSGQTSRVDAVHQAVKRAGERARGAVLASDAFFPMPDGVEAAAEAGVVAIIQPGGSKRDTDAIAACDAAGVAMVFSGVRNFRH
jgi:phosphoribosylaminoimidazolecarboxamide formyltransferase/IMP cyclohydrolase